VSSSDVAGEGGFSPNRKWRDRSPVFRSIEEDEKFALGVLGLEHHINIPDGDPQERGVKKRDEGGS